MNKKTYKGAINNNKTTQKHIRKITVNKIRKNEKLSTKNVVLHYLNKKQSVKRTNLN